MFVVVPLVLLCSVAASARADDVKPLDKQTATSILGFMGYAHITIGAITGGVVPSSKTILAVGMKEGTEVKIQEQFQYDPDLGWFYFEFEETGANGQAVNRDLPPGFGGGAAAHVKLRIWSASGYKQIVIAN
jgi:hypothetical protein